MCYSYEISRDTFAVGTIGTLVNAYIFRNSTFFSLLNIGWYAPTLMQLYDALLWKNIQCKLVTKLALVTNLIQPFAPLLLLGQSGRFIAKDPNYTLVALTCGVYLAYIVPLLFTDYGCMRNSKSISLLWWNMLGGTVYCGTMSILALQLMTLPGAMMLLAYFYITLIAAWILVARERKPDWRAGRAGSIWCWAAAFAPLYNLLMYLLVAN